MQDASRPDREEDSRFPSAPSDAPLDGPGQERLEFLICDPFESDSSAEPDQQRSE
jgi:hypothetical protein